MKFIEAVTGKKYKCDECKKPIDGESIVLKDTPGNITMVNPMLTFLFVDKEGKIMSGYKGPDSSIGDQIAHCPHCGFSHLFGFEPA